MRTSRRRVAAVLLACALAAPLAACGGQSERPGTATDGGGAFPVTVQHKYGTTEVPAPPKRVVTLGLSDQDAVLALGVKPVGVVDWFGERPYGKWPWTKQRWGGTRPEIVGERDQYNMEKIAALEPDLIVAQYSGMTKEQYDTLSQRWPVVAQPKGFPDYLAPWQELAAPVGRALGKQAEMTELIANAERRYAEVREKHPEFAGQTIAVADSFEPGVYSAFTKSDPKAAFFTGLGFRLSPRIGELAQPGQNVVEIGAERLDLLDVDRLVWLTSSESANQRIRSEPLYQRLRVSREGRDVFVPYQDPDVGAAISFNTVLSIPYAIDSMVPLLSK